ncbi:MAG: CmcJ/NvfI family oxidoreductase [Stappiaceae bacterium]
MTNNQIGNDCTGEFTYLAASVEGSLVRNGKVYTRRDGSGNDSPWIGADMIKHRMPVRDARQLAGSQRHTLESNGFEMLPCATSSSIDFLDHQNVVNTYYGECADIIRDVSGAAYVVAFDHNIRSVAGNQSKRRIKGGQQVQPPLHMVHGDYTLTSAPQRLRDLTKPPGANDTLRAQQNGDALLKREEVQQALDAGRFAIINLWRNIAPEPVATHPLALCDAATVNTDDLVVFEIHYSDRIGENYYAKHTQDHQWYYYPGLTHDEALLIKQWDSAGEMARSQGRNADAANPQAPCTFSFHSAFENDTALPDAPDRWSIEVRCMALFR